MTQHREAEIRRQEIFGALLRVIARDGIAAATVRRVAAEAGLSPSALRYHFPDQASLLTEPARQAVTRSLTAPSAFEGTAVERLDAAVQQFLPLAPAQQPVVAALYAVLLGGRAEPGMTDATRDLYAGIRREVTGWLVDLGVPTARRPAAVDDLVVLVDGAAVGLTIGGLPAASVTAMVRRWSERVLADVGPGADVRGQRGAGRTNSRSPSASGPASTKPARR